MRYLLISLLICLPLALSARAQNVEGDWEGTLKAGAAELRLVLHVKKDAQGALQATLDSIDQNAMDIPISSIAFSGGVLKLQLDAIQASYEGKLDAGGNMISGNWMQGGASLPLDFARAKPRVESKPRVPKPGDIDGAWEGSVEVSGQILAVVLHISTYEDGIAAKLDSPDQGLFGLPVTTIKRIGAKLTFEMKQLAASYDGTIDKELKTISGEWVQGGLNLPLKFKRKA